MLIKVLHMKSNYTKFIQLRPDLRQKIEKAILGVFAGEDYYKASMEEIAGASGVSLATIYKYFGSKDGLLLSLADYCIELLTERLIEHLGGIESTKEKLRKVLWAQLDFYERNQEYGKIVFLTLPFGMWIASGSYTQRPFVRVLLEVIEEGQREGDLRSNASAIDLMDLFIGIVRRSFSMWIYRGQQYSLADRSSALFQLIWGGIANPDKKQD